MICFATAGSRPASLNYGQVLKANNAVHPGDLPMTEYFLKKAVLGNVMFDTEFCIIFYRRDIL